MFNIQSLALHVDQLLKQYQLLQQENRHLRAQVADLEAQVSNAPEVSENSLGDEDIASLEQLNKLLDEQLSTIRDKPQNNHQGTQETSPTGFVL